MKYHSWSGWPGAYCLDCGCEDPLEMAMTDNNIYYEYNGKEFRIPPYDEDGNLITEGVRTFIDPLTRNLYPSDNCEEELTKRLVKERNWEKERKNGS